MQPLDRRFSIPKLTTLAFLTHTADQLALAALPLTAVLLFAATPALVGILVAAQSAAWLAVSLPMGVVIDRAPRGLVMRAALLVCALGAGLAILATSLQSLPGLALASFTLASGMVVFVMAQVASLPALVAKIDLTRANARIEAARASAMLAAPFVAGWAVTGLSPQAAYGLATLAALAGLALVVSVDLPDQPRRHKKPSLLASICEGARFVAQEETLRAIGLCAVFWNLAYFGLIATFIPFALMHIGLTAPLAGLALGSNGVGLLLAALCADRILRRTGPSTILVAGPALSLLGAFCILASPAGHGITLSAFGFFLIGFGPMLWLIVQTSIRQLITPPHLIARVTATIQTAIYGVRPVGALAAGLLGNAFGLPVAVAFCLACFAASLAISVLSPLSRMKTLPGHIDERCLNA